MIPGRSFFVCTSVGGLGAKNIFKDSVFQLQWNHESFPCDVTTNILSAKKTAKQFVENCFLKTSNFCLQVAYQRIFEYLRVFVDGWRVDGHSVALPHEILSL